MAPMQWRDATVGGTGATGFEAPGSVTARQEPDVRQVFDQVGIVAVAGSATALPRDAHNAHNGVVSDVCHGTARQRAKSQPPRTGGATALCTQGASAPPGQAA